MTTPEQDLNAALHLAVASYWVSVVKPDRVSVPNLGFGARQVLLELGEEPVTNELGLWAQVFVVISNF